MRLYNFLKTNLNMTKSELDTYKKSHVVTVNGNAVSYTTVLKDGDVVESDGTIIPWTPFFYYLYYKPRGVLSTIRDDESSYINRIKTPVKVTPAGRLDRESEGLMILSNDGGFLNEITGDHSEMDKEYIVTLKCRVTEEFLQNASKSYDFNGRITTPARVEKIDDYHVSMTLYEGIYHQVRRIVGFSHNSVLELKRIRIGKYRLNDMAPGDLMPFEIKRD